MEKWLRIQNKVFVFGTNKVTVLTVVILSEQYFSWACGCVTGLQSDLPVVE